MASQEEENSQEPQSSGAAPPGEATLLVSEFPPPPFYYKRFAELTPPPIPTEPLTRGTRKAAAAAARFRAEAERARLAADEDKTDAILGGVTETEEDGDVVAVFGEIVEDALLVEPLDYCEDPSVVRDNVIRLNQQVVQGFVKLAQDLVHRPTENKKTRDDMTHNIFLMLQECNKFREHQAREVLIELLEDQLAQRRLLIEDLKKGIARADAILGKE